MAIAAEGFTLTFNSVPLSEVREFEVNAERGQPLERFGTWSLQRGTVRLAAFTTAAVPESLYGLRKTLTITAPGSPSDVVIFSEPCVYEDRRIAATANDVVRFDYVFRIVD